MASALPKKEETMVEAAAGATLESADILQIMSQLPHRYPFLLVDRIVDIRGDESCVGVKNVTVNEPQFQGHFPERPIMPGVLLIEAMAQTAGVIAIRAMKGADRSRLVYFVTIDNAKFRKPVTPGDRVEFHMTKTAQKRNIWWYAGRATVDGALVCEAQISVMMGA
jgi:3-hydroxyacyl-[acyl-carrier-protein] dehydratase